MFTTYSDQNDRNVSYHSARVALQPLIAERAIQSVVDFGCGTGSWLYAAKVFGVTDLVGVDGPAGESPGEYVEHDLTVPLVLGRRFDLAICVEVAEHLPESASAVLLDTITDHSDLVLFSAATPGQGGDGHINEQPHQYWDTRFLVRGYSLHKATTNGHMAKWYRANLRLYVKEA